MVRWQLGNENISNAGLSLAAKTQKNTTLQDGAPEAYYKWIYP